MGVVATVALLASVAGTAESIKESQDAAATAEDARESQAASNAVKAASQRRAALREARIRRAQVLSQSEATGTTGSSTALSSTALAGTNAASSIGNSSGALDAANVQSAYSQDIADAQSRSQIFSSVASIGGSVFQAAGGAGAVKSLFD